MTWPTGMKLSPEQIARRKATLQSMDKPCRNGHQRTPETTVIRKGVMYCRICMREGQVRVRAARRSVVTDPLYPLWTSMRRRCNCKTALHYARYGGRGIKVCERWNSFANFKADMGERPPGTSLDRINNDGNYEPSNCRWATRLEQMQNTSGNRLLTIGGETHCVAEWERRMGVPPSALSWRLRDYGEERAVKEVLKFAQRYQPSGDAT